MKLKEIIESVDAKQEVPAAEITPRKKQLYSYYKDQFEGSEPVLMVTFITNTLQGALIVPADNFQEEIDNYLNKLKDLLDYFEINALQEEIGFNSRLLKNV